MLGEFGRMTAVVVSLPPQQFACFSKDQAATKGCYKRTLFLPFVFTAAWPWTPSVATWIWAAIRRPHRWEVRYFVLAVLSPWTGVTLFPVLLKRSRREGSGDGTVNPTHRIVSSVGMREGDRLVSRLIWWGFSWYFHFHLVADRNMIPVVRDLCLLEKRIPHSLWPPQHPMVTWRWFRHWASHWGKLDLF